MPPLIRQAQMNRTPEQPLSAFDVEGLESERIKYLELHNAVSADDDHSHLLVRRRICSLIQHEVHEWIVSSEDTLRYAQRSSNAKA